MATQRANLETTTHVAGAMVGICGRTLQRCCVCGEKLADSSDPEMHQFFAEGGLVKTKYGFISGCSVSLLETKKLPNDFCLRLVER